MDARPTISQKRLAVEILIIVVVGIPLLAYLWDTLNHLVAGVVAPTRLLIAVPVLILFILLLFLLRRALLRWEGERRANVARAEEGASEG